MLKDLKVGDIIELSTDHLELFLVEEQGIKMIARGLEYLEPWDMKGRKEFYKERAEGWLNSGDRHSEETKKEMYEKLMKESNEAKEAYCTVEELQEEMQQMREAFGEPDNESLGRLAVENRWKFYVDKMMKYDGIWWLKPREKREFPSHYIIADWALEEDDLGVDYWQWDRTEWYNEFYKNQNK